MRKPENMSMKHFLFAKEYLADPNATQAAIAAGYSKRSAGTQGIRMLKNDNIRNFIDATIGDRVEKLDITADKILEEIAYIAFFDIRSIFKNGQLRTIGEIDVKTGKALSSIKIKAKTVSGKVINEVVEAKANDKLKALEMLGRNVGLFIKEEEGEPNIKVKVVIDERSKTV